MNDKTNVKKRMPDNLYKMSVLETKYSMKNGNVRCTIICKLADDSFNKELHLQAILKQHPNIKVRSNYGELQLIITETAYLHPGDTFDETTGRHVAETKARLTIARLMREFTLSDVALYVDKAKKAVAWHEEYDRRTNELKEHFNSFKD